MSTVPLADVKLYLGITTTDLDAELQAFVDSAEARIEQLTGPLSPRSVTVTVPAINGRIPTPITPYVGPVTSAVNVLMGGVAYDHPEALMWLQGGVLTLPFGAAMLPGTWRVTYMAGWNPAPAPLIHAVKEMVRHTWSTQRANTFRNNTDIAPGTAHSLTLRVEELIAPYVQAGLA